MPVELTVATVPAAFKSILPTLLISNSSLPVQAFTFPDGPTPGVP